MKIFRQGDVLVRQIKSIPANVKPQEKCILALGEVTGHSHMIRSRATMFRADEGQSYLLVEDGGADLVHEEHSTIALPPGNYQVVIQREYSPEAIRNVQD